MNYKPAATRRIVYKPKTIPLRACTLVAESLNYRHLTYLFTRARLVATSYDVLRFLDLYHRKMTRASITMTISTRTPSTMGTTVATTAPELWSLEPEENTWVTLSLTVWMSAITLHLAIVVEIIIIISEHVLQFPIKRSCALEIHWPKNGGGRLHGKAICKYTHGHKTGGRLHGEGRLLGRIRYVQQNGILPKCSYLPH